MPETPTRTTTSPATTAVICVVLVIGLCAAALAHWFLRYRGHPAQNGAAAAFPRFIQPQASLFRKQAQPLPTIDDLNKYLPMTEFKTWRSQQTKQRQLNSLQPPTLDFLKRMSSLSLSESHLQSPAESPAHLSAMKAGAISQYQNIVFDGTLGKNGYLESSLTPDGLKRCVPTSQDVLSLHVPDIIFSDYACAICLDIMEDKIQVRGLPCGHAFHVTCVDKWLLWRQSCCPVCKASYKKGPNIV